MLGPAVSEVKAQLWDENVGERVATVDELTMPQAGASSPAVVFVMLDTLRRDALSAYGGDPALMPELNGMVRESVVFEDVLANATWTRPSIGSMFTGMYQEYHGAVGREDALRSDVDTLAGVLSSRGYETAAFVANWGTVGKEAGFDRGFESFFELKSVSPPYVRADGVTSETLQWVRSRNDGDGSQLRPLFLYVHYP